MVDGATLEVPMEMLALEWITTYVVHSTVLILAVWVGTSFLRFLSLSTQESLWKAALTGGLATASLQMLLGISSPWGSLALPAALDTAPIELVASPVETPPAVEVERQIAMHRAADMTITTVRERRPQAVPATILRAVPRPGSVWPWVLLALVSVGASVCTIRLVRAWRRLGRELRDRREVVEDPLLETFLTLCDKAGLIVEGKDKKKKPRIKLTATAGIRSPLALRREIVVPDRAIVELTAPQQQAMLAHEMAHVVRRDPSWRLFAAGLEALFFFQPLNVLARKKMQEVAEFQADAWAAEHTGTGAHLAKAIAAVAGWAERGRREPPLATTMAASGSSVVRRVRRLTSFRPGSTRSSRSGFAARMTGVLAMLGAVLWLAPGVTRADPRVQPAKGEGSSAPTDPSDAPESGADRYVMVREVGSDEGRPRAEVTVETEDERVRVDIVRDPQAPPEPPPPPEPSSSIRIIIGGSLDALGLGEGFGYLDIAIDDEEFGGDFEIDFDQEFGFGFDDDGFDAFLGRQGRPGHAGRHADRLREQAERLRERSLRWAERERERVAREQERADRRRDRSERGRRGARHPSGAPGIFEL